jgi:alpha/beta superfamily hydrolase
MSIIPGGESTLLIDGPAGPIELVAMAPRSGTPSGVVIVCHPHSQMGGSLHNKVVHTIARAHRDAGHLAVRFNFRSVGKSAGEFDSGVGESEDLLAVLQWARQQCADGPLYLAGFSVGAYVVARTMGEVHARDHDIHHALLVAPPVHHFEFRTLGAFPCPVTIIMGEEDEVVPPVDVYQWVDTVVTPKALVRVPAAGHFFHGLLGQVKAIVESDIK